MKHRILGRTGLSVSELGLGGGMFPVYGEKEVANAKTIITKAMSLGINYVDTAPAYGSSEKVLGECFKELGQPTILSTKLGGRPKPFDPQDIGALRTSIETSLELLGRSQIDVLLIHEPDRPRQYRWFKDVNSLYGPVTELLSQLKAEGLVKYTGIAGTTVYEMGTLVETDQYDVLLTAFNSSLLWQESIRWLMPKAVRHNMGIVVGSPLQHGALAVMRREEITKGIRWLSEPRRNQFLKLYDLVDELGIPISVLGLRYLISHKEISSILMGVASLKELEENAATIDAGPLPDDVVKRIDEIAMMVPFRPYEEPYKLPFGHAYEGPGHIGSL
jgi:aryl-alcohol dehydrogenase-like predicted oxidoreductase